MTTTKRDELINKLVNQIVSNSKDAKWAREMLGQLKGFYQMDKLIDVPLSDIVESIDFGACVIYKLRTGFMFTAKGGLQTFIEWRMRSICTMLQKLFDLHSKEDKTEDDNAIYDAFSSAILYCFQCIIFSSMDEGTLYGNAADILNRFNEYTLERYNKANPAPESEQDIKENIEEENIARGLEAIADAPLPPEENE